MFWGFTLPAHAYKFTVDFTNGFYWPSFPIGINKLVTNPADGSELARLVGQSENAWEDAVNRELWSFNPGWIVTTAFSGNYIRWSESFGAETGYDPNQTLAITIRYTNGPFMTRTEIILNGQNSALRNNQNGLLYKTILHEMGHTIGLDHSFEPAIMGAFASSVNSLQFDDVEGANAVVDETLYRQQIGYISPLSASGSSTEEYGTCGSVNLLSADNGQGPPGGGFVISLLFGLLLSLISTKVNKNSYRRVT